MPARISKRKLRKSVNDAILAAVRYMGRQALALSLDTAKCYVPRVTGKLARSGYVKDVPKGVELGFSQDYAATVEFGDEGGQPYTGEQTVHIRSFRRRVPPRLLFRRMLEETTKVKEHERVYRNKRLICFRPKYSKFDRGEMVCRVLSKTPKIKGQRFLSRAVEEEVKNLSKYIEMFLRNVERTGEVK